MFWVFYGVVVSSGSPEVGCWEVGYPCNTIDSGISCDPTYLSLHFSMLSQANMALQGS